jgi:hypothetical protein
MSEIGDIYGQYGEALDYSLDNFEAERRAALDALQELYDPFLRTLIRDHSWVPQRLSPRWTRTLQNLRERYGGGERNLSFAAIDGTCDKKPLSEMIVFYGASYAQQGELVINPNNEYLEYRRWSPNQDTSLVAYLPVPLSRLELFEDEEWLFRADDADRSTAAMIHTSLMQLAEIYLAYRRVTEDSPPRIVLL